MPHPPTTWVDNVTDLTAAHMNNIEDSLVIARSVKVTPGTYTLATMTVDQEGYVTFAANGTPGAVADASTTVKGASKASVAPASSTNPIFVGDNDPRMGAATTSQRALLKTSSSNGDPVALLYSDPTLAGYIRGLSLQWNSSTQIQVNPGACYIPTPGTVYNVPTAITATPTLSANAMLYIYVYNNAGTPALDVSATAPTAYKDSAQQKTGDATRRYVGAVKCNSAGTAILKFYQRGDWIFYLENPIASPLLVLNAVTTATESSGDASAVVPPTPNPHALLTVHAGSQEFLLGPTGITYALATSAYFARAVSSSKGHYQMPLDSARTFRYKNVATSDGANVAVLGYQVER